MDLFHISQLPYGKYRRDLLLDYIRISENHRIPINRKYQMNINRDPDLKYLVKKKILIQYRSSPQYFRKSTEVRQTYLQLNPTITLIS